jgi:anti-anti-sigma factor
MANGVRASLRQLSPLIVIDLEGEVTTFADEAVNAAYARACEEPGQAVLFNFAGVDYLNSAGIAILIGVLTEARKAGRRLLVTGLTPHYQKIFRMMGLAQYMPIFETEEQAREFASQ